MEDGLKKWADKNRQEIEGHYSTDLDSLWKDIDKELSVKKQNWLSNNWLKYAAAIMILAVAGFIALRPLNQTEGYALHDLSPDLADTEYYYSTQLGEKMESIKASGVEIDPEVFEDLDQLDQVYRDLMADLKDNADNEEVIEAMIENYRLRLQILENILMEIQDDKESDDEVTI